MTLTYQPFVELLRNIFVDENGNISHLENSKSKKAIKIRRQREREDYKSRREMFLKETKKMRQQLVECRKNAEENRKLGMSTQNNRNNYFLAAAEYDKVAKQLQTKINKMAQKYQVK